MKLPTHYGEEPINVYSEKGKGTTFRIYLPLYKNYGDTDAAESCECADDSEVKKEITGGSETILIGEDDSNVRALMKEVLERYGYKVIEAVDGDNVIAKFLEHKDHIDLMLLDVVMPKKNGKEVYEEIKKYKPDIKALFTSGYTANVIQKKGVLDKGLMFISKPVSPHELLKKVRKVLDG